MAWTATPAAGEFDKLLGGKTGSGVKAGAVDYAALQVGRPPCGVLAVVAVSFVARSAPQKPCCSFALPPRHSNPKLFQELHLLARVIMDRMTTLTAANCDSVFAPSVCAGGHGPAGHVCGGQL